MHPPARGGSSSSSSSLIVVRVVCDSGRLRVEVPQNGTVGDLKKGVAERTSLSSAEDVILSVDKNGSQIVSTRNSERLDEAGIRHGALLHLILKSGAPAPEVTAMDISAPKHLTAADLPPESSAGQVSDSSAAPSSSPANPSASPAADQNPPNERQSSSSSQQPGGTGDNERQKLEKDAESDDKKTGGTVFVNFDQFLKDRGYVTNDLLLNQSYKPIPLKMGQITKLPVAVTLKHQPYRHVDHLEFMNIAEVNAFVQYWRNDLMLLTQRLGWMYGYYREDSHYKQGIRVVVEGIYEPPQLSGSDHAQLVDDTFKPTVDKIAEHLGLECVGLITTSLPKDHSLTTSEAMQMAKLQAQRLNYEHFTGYPASKFVICSVSPSAEAGGEPVPNAYMISDLGIALARDDVLDEQNPEPGFIKLKVADKGELYPQILEGGKPVTKFDVDWLVVKINNSAPRKSRSRFHSASFPRENRGSVQVPPSAIGSHLKQAQVSGGSWKKFADFHLLLFVAKLFDLETSLAICQCVSKEQNVDAHLEELLLSLQ